MLLRFLLHGQNYTVGNILAFILQKKLQSNLTSALVLYSDFEMLHPLQEILVLTVQIKGYALIVTQRI